MASAIINGMISTNNPNRFNISDIILFDKMSEQTKRFASYGAVVASSICDAVSQADCVMLCVKPQNFPEVLAELSMVDNADEKLYVTIAAGITIDSVSSSVNGAPVVRVLPNTPIFIGKGVSAICRSKNVSDDDFAFACRIFSSTSSILTIDETAMNRIISVTSSSPAYVFLFIKAIYDGAVAQGLLKDDNNPDGLSPEQLIISICDTIIGSAELMKSGTKTPEEQIKTVASKGGTTEQALLCLNEYKFSEAIISAMQKCTDRADELGKNK
jgi:pyrroline-5-carboxylate reductase